MPAGRLLGNRDRIKNAHSFFVGIDKYLDPGIANLSGCVNDAKAMLARFDTTHKKILKDDEATRKKIYGVIQEYMNTLKTRDLLILSISAHGTIVNNDFALVTHDTEQDNLLGTVFSTHYALNALSQITKNGAKVLVILDTCHAGAISFDIGRYSSVLTEGGMSCLVSCGPKERSYEYPNEVDGRKMSQGVFTKHLLDGLDLDEGADTKHLGFITLRDLYDYVYKEVTSQFKDQHPVLIGTLEGNTILKTKDQR